MTSAVPFPSYYHGVTSISNFPCYEGDVVITIMLFITDCGIKRGAGAGGGGHEAESSSNLFFLYFILVPILFKYLFVI